MKKFEPTKSVDDTENSSVNEKMSFTSLYTKLYNENFEELERLREKERKTGIIIFACIIGFFVFAVAFPVLAWFLAMIMAVLIIVVVVKAFKNNKEHFQGVIKEQKNNIVEEKEDVIVVKDCNNVKMLKKDSYSAIFKEKIIAPIIKNLNPECEYVWYKGMGKYEYIKGEWESFDLYSSEDQIIAPINISGNEEKKTQLIMSEVHTQNESTDSDGDTHRTTLFHGLAGYMELPKGIGTYIKVKKDALKLFGGPKQKVKMDMSEFEKIFDVEAGDKIKAMQILTPDVMTKMLNMVQTSNVKFEFYINNDMMYIRFHTGNLFEPSVFSKSMQFDKLKKYCDITENVIKMTQDICDIIMSVEL